MTKNKTGKNPSRKQTKETTTRDQGYQHLAYKPKKKNGHLDPTGTNNLCRHAPKTAEPEKTWSEPSITKPTLAKGSPGPSTTRDQTKE